MPIDQKVKEAVRAKLLTDLDIYFREAEEHEDDDIPDNNNPHFRLLDFYRYSHSVNFRGQ